VGKQTHNVQLDGGASLSKRLLGMANKKAFIFSCDITETVVRPITIELLAKPTFHT
jgi:hypothetical protein